MTASGGAAGSPAAEPDERRANIAGAVLVAFAVLIGVVLLAKGFGDDGGLTTSSGSAQASDQGNGQGFDVPTSETTQAPVDPATVKVLVVNGSGTKTGARQVADYLATKGFTGVQIGNAPSTTASVVYVTPGNSAQGQLVASDLGLDPSVVADMPASPPVADLKGASVLVVLGTDGKLANPGATTTTTAGSSSTTG